MENDEKRAADVTPDTLDAMERVVEAAREVLKQMEGRRSATPLLAAIGSLRAALRSLDAAREEGNL